MTKVQDIKSKIKDLKITIDKAIMIQVFNSLYSLFAQFLGILSHKVREKKQLFKLENLAKLLEHKEL